LLIDDSRKARDHTRFENMPGCKEFLTGSLSQEAKWPPIE